MTPGLFVGLPFLFGGLLLSQTNPASPLAMTAAQLHAPQRLLLIPFENRLKDQSAAISEMASDTLQVQLMRPQNRWFQLVDRRQIRAQLAELTFSESALSDPQNALKLGKILSANLMLGGTIASGKIHTSEVTNIQPTKYTWATVQVNATLMRTETGEILYSGKAQGQSAPYPTWQGSTYTSLIVEAVEQATLSLAEELLVLQQGRS